MTPDRWRRVDGLFRSCVTLGPAAQQELLARECEGDAALRRLLEGMLRADAEAADSLRTAVVSCATEAAREPAERWHGRTLGAYRIERQLGAGGMGTVFLARRSDDEYERQVAIKVLSNAFAAEDERRRFLVERQILANLAHPGIAQLLDGGTTAEGVPYLVMEYVEGEPIDEYCAARGLGLTARLGLFLKVCAAVQYAHQSLVIHRDIKPANILVTPQGEPKLLDFGIAKLIDAAAAQTLAGARLLTPRHASPEQIRGGPITIASDVYSLGVLLYRLLTDRYPYGAQGDRTTVEREILETQPARPSAVVAGAHGDASAAEARRRRRSLHGDLDNIVLLAMRKEPERRYPTVREFANDVERFLQRRPVAARADSLGYRLRRFIERHVAGVAAGAVAAATLAGLVSFHTARLAEERDLQARERAAAERVSRFMVELFDVADPQNDQSGVTARQLLDQAYEEIDHDLRGQPLLAADLMIAMGRAYGGLGKFERADELLRKALDIRRSRLDADDPDLAEALFHVGSTEAERGDYAPAREHLEGALGIWRRRLGEGALPVGEALARIGFVAMRESRYEEARAALRRSLAIHSAAVGPDDRRTGKVHALLGSYHWTVGALEQAREETRRALAIEEHAARPNQVRIAGMIHSLGLLEWQLGAYPQAIALYERELDLREKHQGPDHPGVALALYGLGVSNTNVGNYREAFRYYRRAAALQEKVLGPESHYLAMTLSGYGFSLLGVEEYGAAREALSRSLAIFESRFGRDHPDLRAPLAGLSKVAIAERRFGEARERMERALGIVQGKLPADHPDVLRSRVSLADVFRAQGDYARAVEQYEPSIAAFRRTLGLDHPYVGDALCGMGDALAQLGELARADEYYRLAVGNFAAQKLAPRRSTTAACLEGYAALLAALDREVEAGEARSQARGIREHMRANRPGPAPQIQRTVQK